MTTSNKANHGMRPAPQSCAPAVRLATERLRDQAGEVTRDIQELANIAGEAVQENLGHIRENASEYYEQGCNQVHKAERTVEQYIRDQPLKSVLMAAGVGMFLGRFWLRR